MEIIMEDTMAVEENEKAPFHMLWCQWYIGIRSAIVGEML